MTYLPASLLLSCTHTNPSVVSLLIEVKMTSSHILATFDIRNMAGCFEFPCSGRTRTYVDRTNLDRSEVKVTGLREIFDQIDTIFSVREGFKVERNKSVKIPIQFNLEDCLDSPGVVPGANHRADRDDIPGGDGALHLHLDGLGPSSVHLHSSLDGLLHVAEDSQLEDRRQRVEHRGGSWPRSPSGG